MRRSLSTVWDWVSGIAGTFRPSEWSAIGDVVAATAAVLTLVVAIVAAFYAAAQVRDGRKLRQEQSAPYVIVQFEQSQASSRLVDLVIKNIGITPAYDISFAVQPPMERAKRIDGFAFMDARPLRDGIRMLAPTQEVRMLFDDLREREDTDLPSEYRVTVNAHDSAGRNLPPSVFDLDIHWGRDSLSVDIYNLHRIGTRVDRIADSLDVIAEYVQGGTERRT